jgi:hypothetical protein
MRRDTVVMQHGVLLVVRLAFYRSALPHSSNLHPAAVEETTLPNARAK